MAVYLFIYSTNIIIKSTNMFFGAILKQGNSFVFGQDQI
jgi:hypothetical protein